MDNKSDGSTGLFVVVLFLAVIGIVVSLVGAIAAKYGVMSFVALVGWIVALVLLLADR